MEKQTIRVIGGGLAGCEAAWQIAQKGLQVYLYEMKPHFKSPAHELDTLAELVCSNSLRADRLQNAVGLLKAEMRLMDSLIMACADKTAIPAGGALAVDREQFSRAVTEAITNHPLITVIPEKIDAIPEDGITIIATGPLTEGALFESIRHTLNLDTLYFFDAAAPIVTAESINMDIVFRQSRYDKGTADYLNCPMTKTEYEAFWQALVSAEQAAVEDFDKAHLFEGCMPIESMALRGQETIRFGPLKPVGLKDPRTDKQPYACVQLRQDNRAASLYNLVGFQTRLRFPEQKRVFQMIPGLENATFVRYGVMHRNTYLPSPQVLGPDYQVKNKRNLYFAGQMTGVEGYVESAASGLLAGLQASFSALGLTEEQRRALLPDDETVIGAMAHYISDPNITDFQPMNANFGIIKPLAQKEKQKALRQDKIAERALAQIRTIMNKCGDLEVL